jgi:small subunit ribosomal protein S4
MGRYTGPACRLCRREGMKLFLKGARCRMAKCAIETGRVAPGMHGKRPRKMTDYGVQLREKQRMRHYYGMQEGQFRLFFERALRRRGITGEALLQALETRLDNVVFRMGFAASHRAARQLVLHGHVTINGHKASVPSMKVPVNGVVAIKAMKKSQDLVRQVLEAGHVPEVASWIALDRENMKGELLRIPTRDEIAPFVNEQLVVELYSR